MTEPDQTTAVEGRARRRLHTDRKRRRRGFLLASVGAAVCFLLGLAVGQTLNDAAGDGRTVTYERTLEPATVGPPGRTVTVTTAAR